MRSANHLLNLLLTFGEHGKQERLKGCNSDLQHSTESKSCKLLASMMDINPGQETQMYHKNMLGENWRKQAFTVCCLYLKEVLSAKSVSSL